MDTIDMITVPSGQSLQGNFNKACLFQHVVSYSVADAQLGVKGGDAFLQKCSAKLTMGSALLKNYLKKVSCSS